jgi:hypothetical protein
MNVFFSKGDRDENLDELPQEFPALIAKAGQGAGVGKRDRAARIDEQDTERGRFDVLIEQVLQNTRRIRRLDSWNQESRGRTKTWILSTFVPRRLLQFPGTKNPDDGRKKPG